MVVVGPALAGWAPAPPGAGPPQNAPVPGAPRDAAACAHALGYGGDGVRLVNCFADMSRRDLVQRRTTSASGDTGWRAAPLVEAARGGRRAPCAPCS